MAPERTPFDNKFLTTFPTTFLDSSANRTAPNGVVAVIPKKSTPGFTGMEMKLGIVTASSADGKKTYEEPASRVSAANFFPAFSSKELSDSTMVDGQSNKAAPAELVAAALNKPTLGFAGMKTKLDGVLTSPAVFADGKKIMRNLHYT
jgi:hypothetical protein